MGCTGGTGEGTEFDAVTLTGSVSVMELCGGSGGFWSGSGSR